ncbi:MAG: GNAT family N-acetyltransferase [Solirubrobacteraceae bacterium]
MAGRPRLGSRRERRGGRLVPQPDRRKLIRYTEQPDLWEDTGEISREVWPEYNQHGAVMDAYWARLFEDFPAYQFVLWEDEVLGEGHTVPCNWDGTPDGLGEGIDAMVIAAVEAHEAGHAPTALCALAAEIRPRFQGRGLASLVIDAMAEVARTAGLGHLIAPVRPTLKDRYPITPIERYVTWTNEAGEAFDPFRAASGSPTWLPRRPGQRQAPSEAAPPVRRHSRSVAGAARYRSAKRVPPDGRAAEANS